MVRVSWEQETAPVQNLHLKFFALIAESKGVEFSEEKFEALRNADVDDTVKKVLEQIKKVADITINDLMASIGRSRPTITRAIAELKKKGYIERMGSDKTGFLEGAKVNAKK